MKHLYETEDRIIHKCMGSEVVPGEYLVWTLCDMDVPANKSFKSETLDATCSICLEQSQVAQHEQ